MSEGSKLRDRIIRIIRGLREKTVENGATEEEAVEAAHKVSELMEEHDLSMSDLDAREAGFSEAIHDFSDEVDRRMTPIAEEIALMTHTKTWIDASGAAATKRTFFGLPHDVEVAGYLLDICDNAMRYELERFRRGIVLLRPRVRQRKEWSFLDGMARRLAFRLHEIRLERERRATRNALVPLKGALVDEELSRRGTKLKDARSGYRDVDIESFGLGVKAAERVRFDPGVGLQEPSGAIEDQ